MAMVSASALETLRQPPEPAMSLRMHEPFRMPTSLRKLLLLVGAVVVSAARSYNQSLPESQFNGKTWWHYVTILAGDSMEGRDTGSPGLRKAEAYVVEQLKEAGLEPAGTDGYYQPMKFESRQIVERESSVELIHNGLAQPLTLGDDAYFNTRVDLAPEVEAPLVFVGYGLRIPEKQYDDLADLDLAGKVAVVFSGSPADIPTALASHYQAAGERWKAFRKAGAVGIIGIPNPSEMDIPWARMTLSRTRPSMDLADPKFHETEGEKLSLTLNPERAEKIFAGSGHTFREIADLGRGRRSLPRFPLAVSIKAKAKMEKADVESSNVVARLSGGDPRLRDEYVVLSAHIDHLGIGEPVKGDRIYHGAMDNASGDAVLLDVAASLKKSRQKLRRSLLFVFVTGEEKGLLGSRYFASKPTVPVKSMVANINVDMFLPIVPLKVLTVLGLTESDLGDTAQKVAESNGVKVQADPQPLRNLFIRSDQYNFIREGIPAVAMEVAPEPGSPEEKIFKDWLTERYHAPADDLHQPVDLTAAAGYEEVVRGLMIAVANSDQRPQWKSTSFFRRYAGAG